MWITCLPEGIESSANAIFIYSDIFSSGLALSDTACIIGRVLSSIKKMCNNPLLSCVDNLRLIPIGRADNRRLFVSFGLQRFNNN